MRTIRTLPWRLIAVIFALVFAAGIYAISMPEFTLTPVGTQPDGSYRLLLSEINKYNFAVDWGDGVVERIGKCPWGVACGLAPWMDHTFPVLPKEQTYFVKVTARGWFRTTTQRQVQVTIPVNLDRRPTTSSDAPSLIKITACTDIYNAKDQAFLDSWRNRFAKITTETKNPLFGKYCELSDGTKLITYGYFDELREARGEPQFIALIDKNDQLIRKTKDMYCYPHGDVPAPQIDSLRRGILFASCVVGAGGTKTTPAESFEIDFSDFSIVKKVRYNKVLP